MNEIVIKLSNVTAKFINFIYLNKHSSAAHFCVLSIQFNSIFISKIAMIKNHDM